MKAILFSVPSSEESVVTEEDRMPFFYNYYHHHKEIQLTMILKGEGTLVVNNFRQPFKEGEIYFIGSDQPHIFKSSQTHFETITHNRIHAFHIYMDLDKIRSIRDLPEMASINQFLDTAGFGFQVPTVSSSRAIKSMEALRELKGLKKLIAFIELLQYFSEDSANLKSLSGGVMELPQQHQVNRISQIYAYTQQHFRENISLEQIAKISYMTPQAFCKYFKKHTSKTYINFLQEIRVQEACKMIIQGECESISTLAYSCGFNSTVNFHKVFKKYMRVSPGEFIKKHFLNNRDKVIMLAS